VYKKSRYAFEANLHDKWKHHYVNDIDYVDEELAIQAADYAREQFYKIASRYLPNEDLTYDDIEIDCILAYFEEGGTIPEYLQMEFPNGADRRVDQVLIKPGAEGARISDRN
jgi:hypothetical protein